ncbi:MAG: flagellar biosynthetic protein FliQ [Bryobacteraceae bacterium]|nr:flagellar biosynthetic protein FliQ [Bryobacteraceae bacterium]MDW8380049.1 flagellar biosynthetic protein FliQ [Bryobacterales bacterium]
MSLSQANEVIGEMLWTAFWTSAPLLAVGFISGIVVSVVQVVTSIQDSAFGTIPRLIAFLAALLLCLPWMMAKLLKYAIQVLGDFGPYVH